MKPKKNITNLANLTAETELRLNKEILTAFLVGESYQQHIAVEMLQYLLDKYKVMNDDGEILIADLELFPQFGIKGIKSDYINSRNKITPIFVILDTKLILRSKDWLIKKNK